MTKLTGAQEAVRKMDANIDTAPPNAQVRAEAAAACIAHIRETMTDAYGDAREARAVGGREWRCFHCDEVFTDVESALLHFGDRLFMDPACQIDMAEFRAMESAHARCCEEDTDLHREIYRLRSSRQQELMREEEKGYARGLKDAAIPEGWKLVPVEPGPWIDEYADKTYPPFGPPEHLTEERCARIRQSRRASCRKEYAAFIELSAAPQSGSAASGEVDLCEVAAEVERVHAEHVLAEVEAITEGRTDAYWCGFSQAVEEVAKRLGVKFSPCITFGTPTAPPTAKGGE